MADKRPKYRNKKVEYQGITFDSEREMKRYIVLLDAQNKGVISNLELQPTFELIPKVTERVVVHLKTKDKVIEKFVQAAITYRGDFSYIKDGVRVIEDVKISKYLVPKEFCLKEKLFRWRFGYSIKRVYNANETI